MDIRRYCVGVGAPIVQRQTTSIFRAGIAAGEWRGNPALCGCHPMSALPLCSLFCFVFAMECNDVIGSQADADVFSDRMVMVAWHQG